MLTLRLPLKRSEKGLRQTLRFRKGAKPDKSPSPPAARITSGIEMPAICERCEAVFARKVWRRGRRPSNELLSQANRVTYPACEQAAGGPISGVFAIVKGVTEHRNAIERRIANVVRLASARQPERRIVSPGMGWRDTRCFHHVSEARASNCHGAGESFRRQAHLRMER